MQTERHVSKCSAHAGDYWKPFSHLFCFVFGMFRDNFVIVKQNAQLPFQGNFHCKLCRHEAQGSVFLALRSP